MPPGSVTQDVWSSEDEQAIAEWEAAPIHGGWSFAAIDNA